MLVLPTGRNQFENRVIYCGLHRFDVANWLPPVGKARINLTVTSCNIKNDDRLINSIQMHNFKVLIEFIRHI